MPDKFQSTFGVSSLTFEEMTMAVVVFLVVPVLPGVAVAEIGMNLAHFFMIYRPYLSFTSDTS